MFGGMSFNYEILPPFTVGAFCAYGLTNYSDVVFDEMEVTKLSNSGPNLNSFIFKLFFFFLKDTIDQRIQGSKWQNL